MYEEAILGERPQAAGELRPLGWDEIVARLAAARDLRLVLRAAAASASGSFDPAAAQRIHAPDDNELRVNPVALAIRKAADGKASGTASDAVSGDREK